MRDLGWFFATLVVIAAAITGIVLIGEQLLKAL